MISFLGGVSNLLASSHTAIVSYYTFEFLYENLPFLQAIHPATKAMRLDSALAGLPVALHPGAARYYKEMGVEVPAHLVSK